VRYSTLFPIKQKPLRSIDSNITSTTGTLRLPPVC
jgi:hypothetical protein